jgi:hypothetical protein
MLDTRFKSLHLVSSFVSHEQDISIIKKYDKKILSSYAFEVLSSVASCAKL